MTWNWFEFAIDAALFSLIVFCFWAVLKVRRGEGHAIRPMTQSLLPGNPDVN